MKSFINIYLIALVGSGLISCTGGSTTQEVAFVASDADGFVGEGACIECHQQAYDDWQGSHHDWAMQLPNDTTVFADFNNTTFAADSVTYHFSRNDSAYFVKTVGDDGLTKEFEVAYTFGVTPLQQYLIKFPDGKYQTLRATWDTEKKEWFNQYAGQVIPHDDWLHWSQGGQRWNTMCAECHSTNLKKNYEPNTDAFNTTYSVINVSCEACHGPGLEHVTWASGDTSLGEPKVLMSGVGQKAQLNLCAACHARRVKLTDVIQPDVAFADQFLVQNITDEFYHPDGQIKEEDYVIGSFMQSRMYAEGVKCSDCHNVHSMELKTKGNALCLQCHLPNQYNTPDHHFHKMDTEEASCISCHMTGDYYMGNDFRRDHSFRVPRPDQSVEYNTPNACIGCHEDQSNEWAAEWIVKWYGPDRADHFSDHLLVATNRNYTSEQSQQVLSFINDLKYPPIARATAMEYVNLTNNDAELQMLLTALNDSSSLIRYQALSKLRIYPPNEVLGVALAHVKDSTRLVRIAAARLIVELDVNQLEPAQRNSVLIARSELDQMMAANADFPLGRMQMGDHYMRQNNVHKAIEEYEMALKMDHLLTAVYTNLATAYNMIGENSSAISTLNKLIELEPAYGRAYYLRGLLLNELNDTDGAQNDLKRSIELDPYNFRGWYNYATLLKQNGELDEAEKTIKNGLQYQPENPDGEYLLALIYQEQGRTAEAQVIIARLQAAQSN